MKRLVAPLLCALALLPGCFTAAGSIVGQQIQVSQQSRGEESHAHVEGTAIGVALDVAAVMAIVAVGASRLDFSPSQPSDYGVHD